MTKIRHNLNAFEKKNDTTRIPIMAAMVNISVSLQVFLWFIIMLTAVNNGLGRHLLEW